MTSFSPTEAAFEGFKFTRVRPGAIAAWAGATFGFNLVSGLLGALVGGDALRAFNALGRQPELSEVGALLLPAVPALAITTLVNLAGASLVYASAIRSCIGIDKTVTFRLSHDERRIFLILIGYGLIYGAVSIITAIGYGLLENISSAFSADVVAFMTFAAPVVLICVPTAVIVRLSLTPLIAIDRKRISLKESWVSTKGHFWPLARSLGVSVILFFIVAFVAIMLVMILTELLSMSTGGAIAKPGDLFNANQAVTGLFTPALVFGAVASAVAVAALLPVLLGPLVRAYYAYDAPPVVVIGDLTIDLQSQTLSRDGQHVALSGEEYALLASLVESEGRVRSYHDLLATLGEFDGHRVDVQLLHRLVDDLRQKIETDPSAPRSLLTEPGKGYRFALEHAVRIGGG